MGSLDHTILLCPVRNHGLFGPWSRSSVVPLVSRMAQIRAFPGVSRLSCPPSPKMCKMSRFAPVSGRDDGATALGLSNWNTLQGFWRALMAMGSGCPGGDLHPSRAWWTGLGLGFSEALCLARGLFPLLGGPFLGLPLCVPALSAYPVLLGTRLTARLVRDGASPACETEPEGLGLLAFSLGVAAFVFLALRPLGPLQLVLVPVLLSGFDLGRCLWLDPGLRLLYFLAGAGWFFVGLESFWCEDD